ncbi:hypothetical protein D9619_004356 [Psilocybe cf. subviscida]|uniref:Uncharacterized protein n=1 Tax=Psilocybe cf. subviscida TaxID=2480587 RepID=A0A8H5F7U0_9AGAR|nr:hypothetical protein D9619_004356 [Psilocybe cf. subviscida]
MAATTSSVHSPLGEDNNLTLGGAEAKLTRNGTTRTVLPNLGYPLQSTTYGRHRAAQPTLSSVDASPASCTHALVGFPRFGSALLDGSAWLLHRSILESLVAALAYIHQLESLHLRRIVFMLKLMLQRFLETGKTGRFGVPWNE